MVCAVVSVACSTPQTRIDPSADPSDAAVSPVQSAPEHDADDNGPALTREEIRMVVRAKLPQIRACFEAGLATTPELGGRVLLRFAIAADGKAHAIEVVEDQLADPAVAACIVAAIPSWQFPRPRGGRSIVISYPFAFSSEQSLRAAGLPRVEGTVKPEAVGAVFDARRSELDVCVSEGTSGSIGVAFTVDDAGSVTKISVYESNLPSDVGDCVTQTLASWRFPPAASGDEARINHDLHW